MAFFTDNDFGRLDLQLLQNGCVNLYWSLNVLDEDVTGLKNNGYQIDNFECSKWNDMESLLVAIAEGLKFPDYFGKNLNALNDCLGDLDIPVTSGRVIVFRGFDKVSTKLPDVVGALLDVLAINARRFLLFGRRLIILVQSDDPKIAFDPFGAETTNWNPKEWLNKNRGL